MPSKFDDQIKNESFSKEINFKLSNLVSYISPGKLGQTGHTSRLWLDANRRPFNQNDDQLHDSIWIDLDGGNTISK